MHAYPNYAPLIEHIQKMDSPTLDHDLIDSLGASRRGRKTIAGINLLNSLQQCEHIHIMQFINRGTEFESAD